MKHKEQMIAIVQETIAHYERHPRALDAEGTCMYEHLGARCAVGRCLLEETIENLKAKPVLMTALATKLVDSCKSKLDDLLKPEYRGMPEDFWYSLQRLHDNAHFWQEGSDGKLNQLTKYGVDFAQSILVAINIDDNFPTV